MSVQSYCGLTCLIDMRYKKRMDRLVWVEAMVTLLTTLYNHAELKNIPDCTLHNKVDWLQSLHLVLRLSCADLINQILVFCIRYSEKCWYCIPTIKKNLYDCLSLKGSNVWTLLSAPKCINASQNKIFTFHVSEDVWKSFQSFLFIGKKLHS